MRKHSSTKLEPRAGTTELDFTEIDQLVDHSVGECPHELLVVLQAIRRELLPEQCPRAGMLGRVEGQKLGSSPGGGHAQRWAKRDGDESAARLQLPAGTGHLASKGLGPKTRFIIRLRPGAPNAAGPRR